jgi:hypothetical protein
VIRDGRHLIPQPFSSLPTLLCGVFISHPKPTLVTSVDKTGNLFPPHPSEGRGIIIRYKQNMILGGRVGKDNNEGGGGRGYHESRP